MWMPTHGEAGLPTSYLSASVVRNFGPDAWHVPGTPAHATTKFKVVERRSHSGKEAKDDGNLRSPRRR